MYLMDAELLGGYSKIPGKDGITSTSDRWSISPNYKFNDKILWINLYAGTFERIMQVVAQEEGGRLSSDTFSESFYSAFKIELNERWSIRPLFFADWVFVDETKDESLGNGLYDYRDIGGGLESTWVTLQEKDLKHEFRLGYRFFKREYPNFRSLLSLFDPNGSTEVNEKDFYGHKLSVGFESQSRDQWSWAVEAATLYKDFTDKLTINSSGIRTSDLRQDWLEVVSANASHPLNENFRVKLDTQFSFNLSNLDFYDTHNTLTLADDNFIKNYFDYILFSVGPTLIYRKEIEKNEALVLSVGYRFQVQHYPGRKAQDAAGLYQSNDQEDLNHVFQGRLSVPINKNFSWVTSYAYTLARSNQKFENFYLYSYDNWNVLSGVSFNY